MLGVWWGTKGRVQLPGFLKRKISPRTGRWGDFTLQRSLYPLQFPNRSSAATCALPSPAHGRVPDWNLQAMFSSFCSENLEKGIRKGPPRCPSYQQEAKSSAGVRHLWGVWGNPSLGSSLRVQVWKEARRVLCIQ